MSSLPFPRSVTRGGGPRLKSRGTRSISWNRDGWWFFPKRERNPKAKTLAYDMPVCSRSKKIWFLAHSSRLDESEVYRSVQALAHMDITDIIALESAIA